jgi:hypothetical protein
MSFRDFIEAAARQSAAWLRRAFTLDVRSLAAFRVAIGGIVAADAVLRTRDVGLMFAPDGLFPLPVLRQYLGGPCAWSLAMLVEASWCGPAILILEAAAGLLLAAGCGTRWATVAAWVAVVSVLRRTAPATNAGDSWLACLLFWGMFLPLGAAWSRDQRWAAARGSVLSVASAALVLQIAVVYVSAGLSKWNDSWLSGDAIRHVMSVHDHGTPLGERLFACGWLSRPLSWGVIGWETLGPLALLFLPRPSVRLLLVVGFMAFHAATCLTMSVGLFGYVGLAAWLAVVPGQAWDRLALPVATTAPAADQHASRIANLLGVTAGMLACVSLVHDLGRWRESPLPRWLAAAIDIPCMHQEWRMFDAVLPQEQWAYARGELADGSLVDVVRNGRPLQTVRPDGGFTSLPHHRWHKLFWCLATRRAAAVGQSVAAALARDWNARHGPREQLTSLEVRLARQSRTAGDDTLHDILLAAWPDRDAVGSGGLDRLIQAWRTQPGPDGESTIGEEASDAVERENRGADRTVD